MRKTIVMLAALFAAIIAWTATEEVDGLTWSFSSSNGQATITGVSACSGDVVVPERLGGFPVVALAANAMSSKNMTSVKLPETITSIGNDAFIYCKKLEEINIPSSVRSIGKSAFQECNSLREIVIPEGVTQLSFNTFLNCGSLRIIVLPETLVTFDNSFYSTGIFSGCSKASVFVKGPPTIAGLDDSKLSSVEKVCWPKLYGSAWLKKMPVSKFGGWSDVDVPKAFIVSSSIRENDPTVIDVVYKVTCNKPSVKVRVLAFEDGERSFAKVVRPETFIEGTEVNVGDNVTPNVEHTISWRVSSDWTTKLAKVKFEVLAMEENLVPLELMTISASDQYGAMKISWNAISEQQWFDALLWLYADHDSGLSLANGVLRNGSVSLAKNAGFFEYTYTWSTDCYNYDYRINAANYVLSKIGFSRLSGNVLNYANQETRLGLSPSGSRQYAYKMVP